MSGDNISIFIAFLAGLLSFLSPCVLPLVPGYLGHLAGVTTSPGSGYSTKANSSVSQQQPSVRLVALTHALVFVTGFSLVFVTFWVSLGTLGQLLPGYIRYVKPLGGVILIILGLNMAGVFRIPLLYRTFKLVRAGEKPQATADLDNNTRGAGLPTSFFTGVVFAAGWTPCIGPVLGGIIGLASESSTIVEGTYLLLAYSLGLGVPFMLCAFALGQANNLLRRLNRRLNRTGLISVISGLMVVFIGVLMVTGVFQTLPQYFNWLPL